jgi:hypothetical protein
MKVKTGKWGADVRFMRTEIVSKLWNIEQIILYHCPWIEECTITSGNDGKHMKRSKHYKNTAVDIRTWAVGSGGKRRYIDDEGSGMAMVITFKDAIIRDIEGFLGPDYQLVWHDRDHAHIEWDP